MKNSTKKIFQDEKNNPVVFFFRPCAARSKIHPIVEEHGGKITARLALNAIKLANDEDYLVSDDYYSVRYIEDCVKANKLLEKEKYRLKPRRMVIRDASDAEVSDISFDDDISFKLTANSKHFQGRKIYNYTDDMKILNFIIKHKYHDRVGGNTIWEEMEQLGITAHSGQSMNSRFRKILKFSLNLYPIPLEDKLKLNPDYLATSNEANSTPEKNSTPTTPQKEAGKGAEPMSLATRVLSRTPKTSTPTKQNVKTPPSTSSPTKQNVKTPPSTSTPTKQNVKTPQSASKLRLTSSPKKMVSAEKSKCSSKTISEDSGNGIDTISVKRSTTKVSLQFESSTKKQILVAEKQDSPSKLNTSQNQGERSSARLRKRMNKENEDKNSESPTESTPSKLKKGNSSERRSTRTIKPPNWYSTTSPQKELQKKSDSTETGQSGKTSTSPKPDKKSQKTLYNAEGSSLTPSQVNNGKISPRLKASTTSVDCMFKKSNVSAGNMHTAGSKSKPLRDASCLDDSTNEDELEDDFDKELMKRVAKTSTQVSDDEEKTRRRSNKETGGQKNMASQGPQPGKTSRTSTLANQKSGSPRKKTRTSYVTVFDDDEYNITEIEPEQMETENMLDEAETKDLINGLCSEYQLTVHQVQYILYINNGDVNDTLEWLRTSGERNGKVTWDVLDDDKLDGNLDQLYRKYGETMVQNRIRFLDEV